ncbi:rhamnogalacturonan lyase B N-terminal domain-containing protein [Roseateles sp. BYS96W]|uniref:rhamnogalacturonan endolyase n=1 Tax=Pelomonas nitida TaxID=3299027 RepID=A0ABW7G8T9_9BURK
MNTTSSRPSWARWLAAGVLASMAPAAMAAFSITTVWDGNNPAKPQYIIDTDAGLVFKVRGYDNGASTTSAGDLSSLVYNGVEYADPARGTQLNSGADWLYANVGAVAVTAELVAADGSTTPAATSNGGVVTGSDYIKVTLTSTSTKGGVLTHYYLAKKGEANIHMGTHFTEQPDVHGLVRFIARIPIAKLPDGGPAPTAGGLVTYNGESYWAEDLRGTSGAIEASDVFGFASTDARYGQSRSKHYANRRLKDWQILGGTGPGVGIWFWRDNHEGDSGGPFYRSLLQQITGTTNELTYMVNYGEAQTEAFRLGVLNTYLMMFTDGSLPTVRPDTSWYGAVNLDGYVPPLGRGSVSVAGVSGRVAGIPYTAGFANSQAQYWVDVDPVDGHFTSTGMLPGVYTMTLYKGELGVQTAQVTVTANADYAMNPIAITADPGATPALWRIGEWDGSPQEFINGDRLTFMHPSDVRMASWNVGPYVIGSSSPATGWPAYQWKDVNNGLQVQFTLKRGQNTAPLRLRVGLTADFNGARPQVSVNSWTSAIPAAPAKVSRNMTVGTYRGVNRTYSFDIPAAQLVVGTNVLTINTVSGTAGTRFLSPSLSFDAVDLVALP